MSQYTADYVKNKLIKELQADPVEVEDISDGCGAKFNCLIVSKLFEGNMLINRHRMVNKVFEEEMKTIHAFSMRTLTPAEFAEKNVK